MMRQPGGALMAMPLRAGEDPFALAARFSDAGDPERMRQAEWCVVTGPSRTPRWPSPEPWGVTDTPERDTND